MWNSLFVFQVLHYPGSCIFQSCIFSAAFFRSWIFQPCIFRPVFSSPAFSSPAFSSTAFSCPAFSAPPRRSVTALVLVVHAAVCSRWSVGWRRNFAAPPQSVRAEQVDFEWMQSASSVDQTWRRELASVVRCKRFFDMLKRSGVDHERDKQTERRTDGQTEAI